MKIAYITSSLEGSGGPLPIPSVTRVLRDKGARVEVFALSRRDGKALPGMLEDCLKVHIREGGNRDHWKAYQWLDQQIKEYKPTLLWTSVARASIIGLILGKKYSIPVICWQHNAYMKLSRHILYYVLRRRPAMWVGDSDVVSSLTAPRFKVSPDRMATWPLFATDPNAPQAKPWKKGQTLRIGSLGRLHPQKSYDILIDSLALLKKQKLVSRMKFEVVIAGDGGLMEDLKKSAKTAGCDELKFIGYEENPKEFLANLHLYVQSSNLEGFCIAVHEAMQAGLPVIATAVGQIPFTIEPNVNGWLVPKYDAQALANAIAIALNSPTQLAEKGKAGREKVLSHYSREAFQKSGGEILDRLNASENCNYENNQVIN